MNVGDDGIGAQLFVEVRLDGIVRDAVRPGKADIESRFKKRDPERLRAAIVGTCNLFREIDDAGTLGLGAIAADGDVLRDDAVLRIWREVRVCAASVAEPRHAVPVFRAGDHRLEVERSIRQAFRVAAHEADDDLVVNGMNGVGDQAREVVDCALRIFSPGGAHPNAVHVGIGENRRFQVFAIELHAVFIPETGNAIVAETREVNRRMVRHPEIVVYPDDRRP